MSILGVGDGIAGLLGTVIDKIFPDPAKAAQAKALLADKEFAPLLAQIQVNLIEAANANIFVSGWRPYIGWVCGSAFAYQFVIQPFLVFGILIFIPSFPTNSLPRLDWTELGIVLFGMLGLSRNRTQEKLEAMK